MLDEQLDTDIARHFITSDHRHAAALTDPLASIRSGHPARPAPCLAVRQADVETTQPLLSDALAPTLYGLGHSLQEWAVAVLDHCEGEELIVVGSSVGGSCALEIARASPDQVRGIVLVGAKASVRRDPVAREVIVRALQDDGIHAAWASYWAPLFSSTADAETLAAARRLALEQDVDDLIRGVRALHDRRDQAEFVSAWAGHLVVVSGARDRTPTPAAAAASVAGGRYEHVVVEDGGH